ncbi:O-succinylhomoserine (thiol)-lyase [Saccharobesus litoralis]|uniref:O-succinylhomoserine (Thiol)-lyase n=1 Tax=Saccharobesus litoralis TaxID=2172099 RepID=A0A2S0VQI6_9ALTE|nr:cystathionine gamma-synthase [Saccharobesus litoralis]AWB66481.1 O-succinylhomoserine (thiol)-lyase [Saccharobesus litoralis]
MSKKTLATIAVRGGIESDKNYAAVVPPIYLSSTYAFAGFDKKGPYDYSRCGNPTRDILAETLAELEQGEHGIVTATGTAAINLALQLLSPDDLLVVPHDCYGGSYRLFVNLADKGNFKLKVINMTNQAELDAAIAAKPKLIWVETPSNPLLRIVDLKKICAQAKAQGALVAVDNTFLTPVCQQPLTLGADIVVHSATKYINGHSDVVSGALITKTKELGEELAWWANCIGITGGAFDSYLTLRGVRTLVPRMRQHQENANKLVALLDGHAAVDTVYHPSLPSHPGHEIAKEQQHGFGAMLSFELKGGVEQVTQFIDALEHFSLAESLGGTESLVCHPSTMTHAAMDAEAQAKAGISQTLMRFSVGIEDGDELVEDVKQALDSLV